MPDGRVDSALEVQIDQWRTYLRHRQAIHAVDAAELEDHLREQVSGLVEAGLASDEAFLIAVKRMGDLDALSREFAREHSERLWKQLVMSPDDGRAPRPGVRHDAVVAFTLAGVAALAIKLPELFGRSFDDPDTFYPRNLPLFILPILAGFFAWKRQLRSRTIGWLAAVFGAAAVAANILPGSPRSATSVLAIVHLPVALWLTVGVAYAGVRWRDVAGRMDFIRFSGELLIYYALIAMGGGILTAFLFMMFQTVGVNVEPFVQQWLIPCGAAGAVLVAAWLVEAKQSVIENMAPVLTRLFTPLFTAVLITFLGVLVWTGNGVDIERNMLIAFDVLLVVVLGLLLYSASARPAGAPAGPFDVLQVVLLVSALIADAVALRAIGERITEWGLSPNRAAVLGVNLLLLVNLAWSAVLYVRFLRRRGSFGTLEKWQTDYLPVYAAWAAIVVIVFPPLFGYR